MAQQRTPEQIIADEKFINAGHKAEVQECNHQNYDEHIHGRYCSCGTAMRDYGD